MSKFRGSLDFEYQENNWLRCFAGKGYLAHLLPKSQMQLLLNQLRQEPFSIETASTQKDEQDAMAFEKMILWLPKLQCHQQVYLANILGVIKTGNRSIYVGKGNISAQCKKLSIEQKTYENRLEMAIKMLKRHGGLA